MSHVTKGNAMSVHQNLTGAQRTARYRAAKRAQGMRLKQIWVRDVRDPKVRARLRADAAALAAQGSRWADIIDDAEAMSAEVLDDLPPYDWGDDPRGNPEH
jgi:regulator of protease activity HflC (stomatin/prohibitin superfamily)